MGIAFANARLLEDVTVWLPTGVGPEGSLTWGAPTVIKARVEYRTTIAANGIGEEVQASTVAFTDREVPENAWLFEGISVDADPTAVPTARRVQASSRVPSLDYSTTTWSAFL